MQKRTPGALTPLASLLSIALLPWSAFQQQSPADLSIKVNSELVIVDAEVRNKKTGKVVYSLARENFILFEDGVKQEITHYSQDLFPLSILLVIDTSGSVWSSFMEVRKEALEALELLRPEDEVALMATASRTEVIQSFTRDKKQIAEAIATFDERSLGEDGILVHDAVFAAAAYVRRAASPRKRRAIIFVTDGIGTQLRFRGHSEKEALRESFEADSTICSIIVKLFDPINRKIVQYHPQRLLSQGSIVSYVHKTGGETQGARKQDIGRSLADVIHNLRNRYSLGYISSNTKPDGAFRKIDLRLTSEIKQKENAAVRSKPGYYRRDPSP